MLMTIRVANVSNNLEIIVITRQHDLSLYFIIFLCWTISLCCSKVLHAAMHGTAAPSQPKKAIYSTQKLSNKKPELSSVLTNVVPDNVNDQNIATLATPATFLCLWQALHCLVVSRPQKSFMKTPNSDERISRC